MSIRKRAADDTHSLVAPRIDDAAPFRHGGSSSCSMMKPTLVERLMRICNKRVICMMITCISVACLLGFMYSLYQTADLNYLLSPMDIHCRAGDVNEKSAVDDIIETDEYELDIEGIMNGQMLPSPEISTLAKLVAHALAKQQTAGVLSRPVVLFQCNSYDGLGNRISAVLFAFLVSLLSDRSLLVTECPFQDADRFSPSMRNILAKNVHIPLDLLFDTRFILPHGNDTQKRIAVECSSGRKGKSVALHMHPSNIDTMNKILGTVNFNDAFPEHCMVITGIGVGSGPLWNKLTLRC